MVSRPRQAQTVDVQWRQRPSIQFLADGNSGRTSGTNIELNSRGQAPCHCPACSNGGRQDIFLGTRDCQGYVEPCPFGSETGHYDGTGQLAFGLMFHGFDYPDEAGEDKLEARFWRPTMINGYVRFDRPEDCAIRKFVREMTAKKYGKGRNLRGVEAEATAWGLP